MTEEDKADVRKIVEEELAKLPKVIYVPVYPVPQYPASPAYQPWFPPGVTCVSAMTPSWSTSTSTLRL